MNTKALMQGPMTNNPMAENSDISWTTHTCNLWWGCSRVHAGCDNCYAERLAKRWKKAEWGDDSLRVPMPNAFADLDKWQRQAEKSGKLATVFVGSMMDIFEKPMPTGHRVNELDNAGKEIWSWEADGGNTGEIRDAFFKALAEFRWPSLKFLLLTKRPSNISKYWPYGSLPNVWFGTSVGTGDPQIDHRMVIHLLAHAPDNSNLFLSCEPLLGPVTLDRIPSLQFTGMEIVNALEGHGYDFLMEPVSPLKNKISWVIVGGESGPSARPMHPEWARSLRDQCEKAGTRFHFKQWGEWVGGTCDSSANAVEVAGANGKQAKTHIFGDGFFAAKVGLKAAGKELDWQLHDWTPITDHNK